jgi:hypothetical protein
MRFNQSNQSESHVYIAIAQQIFQNKVFFFTSWEVFRVKKKKFL